MEADWEVEVGAHAPVIEAHWTGYVDLRKAPERVAQIDEVRELPGLAHALVLLNGHNADDAQLWTAKCDVWIPNLGDTDLVDADEMDASREESAHVLACYIDILPWKSRVFPSLQEGERWVRTAVSRLRALTCRCSRVDLVLRQAVTDSREGLGVTAYLLGCGIDAISARKALNTAVTCFAETVVANPLPRNSDETLQ